MPEAWQLQHHAALEHRAQLLAATDPSAAERIRHCLGTDDAVVE